MQGNEISSFLPMRNQFVIVKNSIIRNERVNADAHVN